MEILLFKTNVDPCKLPTLRSILKKVDGIQKWTIDLDDCDRVLRITSTNASEVYIEILLKSEGFECTPMAYEF
jgi:hypothetical protein